MILSIAAFASPDATQLAEVIDSMKISHEITLVSAGSSPKKVIRWAPTPGDSTTYEMINRQHMKMTLIGPDGQPMDLPQLGDLSPTTILEVTHTVLPSTKNGFTPVNIHYGDMRVEGVPPKFEKATLEGLEQMRGMEFRLLVNNKTGNIEQMDVDTKDDALFEATQSFVDQFLTKLPTFPSEKVGVGAVWTIDSHIGMMGMNLSMVQTVTLTNVDATGVDLDLQFALDAGDSKLDLPGLPAGAEWPINGTRRRATMG